MKVAIVIGIDYLKTSHKVEGCEASAIEMSKWFKENGYSVKTLTTESQTTKSFILSTINKAIHDTILETITEVFLYYSGHGLCIGAPDSRSNFIHTYVLEDTKGHSTCMVPIDYYKEGLIVNSDLMSIFCKTSAKIRCMFDCCHSDSILDLDYTVSVQKSTEIINYHDDSLHTPSTKGLDIISITGLVPFSTDSWILPQHSKSLWIGTLASAFRYTTKLQNNDFTAISLINGMDRWLIERGISQKPMITSTRKVSHTSKFF